MAVRPRQRLIVGLVPEPTRPVPADLRAGLADLKIRMEQRAQDRLTDAIRSNAPWLAALGPAPADQRGRARWRAAALTTAAYRDMYGIDSAQPLGPPHTDSAQRIDHARARQAITARRTPAAPPIRPGAPASGRGVPVLGS
jgi:hypothetical protein